MTSLARHCAWNSGLALSNHIGALRPEFIDASVDYKSAVDQIRNLFNYDDKICDNPSKSPKLFRSCQERHPGVCESYHSAEVVLDCVRSLQSHLERNKLQPPVCMLAEYCLEEKDAEEGREGADASSSSHAPALKGAAWYMLGCVSKRPLCHVMAALAQHPTLDSALEMDGSTLCTSYELVVQILHRFNCDSVKESEKLALTFRVFDYSLEPHKECPNAVLYQQCRLIFSVGLNAPDPGCSANNISSGGSYLPFGLQPAKKPQVRQTKRDADDDAGDLEDISAAKRKREQRKQKDIDAAASSSKPSSSNQGRSSATSTSAAAFDAEQDQEAEDDVCDATPVTLSEAQRLQLKAAILSAAGAEEDVVVSQQPPDKTEAVAAASKGKGRGKGRGSYFHERTGLLSCIEAKRTMVCYICNHQISRGEHRFEYVFQVNRPQRSIHIECVGLISAVGESLKWLQDFLQDPARNADLALKARLQHSLSTLQNLRSVS